MSCATGRRTETRPDLLIATEPLEQSSGLALVEQPRELAAMNAAAVAAEAWREPAPDLSASELEPVALLVQGRPDRQIAEVLQVSDETARSPTEGSAPQARCQSMPPGGGQGT